MHNSELLFLIRMTKIITNGAHSAYMIKLHNLKDHFITDILAILTNKDCSY